jgi:hypothetical protein
MAQKVVVVGSGLLIAIVRRVGVADEKKGEMFCSLRKKPYICSAEISNGNNLKISYLFRLECVTR